MNTQIKTLSFQNFPVSFRADGYLNATEIAEHFGKRINNYLRNERTQEYISALIEFLNIPETQNRATAENQLVIVKKGGNDKSAQGTWLHPKLAIDFARWLNPKFAVWCDMQIEKILHQNSGSLKTTKDDRTGLRQAVTALVGKFDISHSEAYKLVHHRFNVASIEDLNHEQIVQAVEYVHRLILDGELLDKEPEQPKIPEYDYGMARLFVKYGAGVAEVHDLHMALYQLSHIQNTFLKMLEHKALHFPMNQAEQKCVDILAHWQMAVANVGCKL